MWVLPVQSDTLSFWRGDRIGLIIGSSSNHILIDRYRAKNGIQTLRLASKSSILMASSNTEKASNWHVRHLESGLEFLVQVNPLNVTHFLLHLILLHPGHNGRFIFELRLRSQVNIWILASSMCKREWQVHHWLLGRRCLLWIR